MKIYIAGAITDDPDYQDKFDKAEAELTALGYTVLKPSVLPSDGFSHEEYITITKAMISVCEGVYFLADWVHSKGCLIELDYALANNKKLFFETNNPHIRRAKCLI